MVQLEDLPVEIIWHVIKCLGYARDVSHLSLACKGLYSIVVKDGYQLFVQDAFPTISIPAPVEYAGNMGAFFKDAAHSLTTLSRNWDRKAFIAHHALPFSLTQQSRHGGQSQQTMGFTPAIDSHETWYGNDWRDRYQVLVCGAGSRLYIRLIDLGKIFYPESRRDEPSSYQQRWETYNERGTLDGRDDIVAVKLLPQASRNRQHMVVARTSGDLAIISFDIGRRRFARDVTFDTRGLPVKSMTLNHNGLLAVCLSNRDLACYNTDEESLSPEALQWKRLDQSQEQTRTNVTCWLRNDRLAIGNSAHKSTVEIYNAAAQKLENLSLEDKRPSITLGKSSTATTYCLAPLPASSQVRRGDLFLSGQYDGVVRLHDLRSASSVVARFEDNVDTSAIYSLMTYGQERFVAGAAFGSHLKIFDLRISGARRYYSHSFDPESQSAKASQKVQLDSAASNKTQRSTNDAKDWNLYLIKSGPRNRGDSPVYSLSKPSEYSPTFFAGLENTLCQVDLVSIMDKYPDPVYGKMPKTGNTDQDIKIKWTSRRQNLRLPGYEHPASTHDGVKLRKQRPVGFYEGIYSGLDERWAPV